jgi:outer membrane protein assembly factor BamB
VKEVSSSFSSGLAGLSLLTGTNAFASLAPQAAAPTRAVLKAKAQFTTPAATPPWSDQATKAPRASLVATIRRMPSLIDKADPSRPLNADVQTAFQSYKALDRLRTLADAAADATTSSAERKQLSARFRTGLAELQAWMASAPSDKLKLHFDKAQARRDSLRVQAPAQDAFRGTSIAASKDAPIAGLTGSETFEIRLAKLGVTDTVRIDLSAGAQPPSISSIVQAFNAGIVAIPERNADGTPKLDAAGNPVPRYMIRIEATKDDKGWGLAVVPAGLERMSFQEVGAGDALMIAAGRSALDWPAETRLIRMDSPEVAMEANVIGTMTADDARATEAASLLPPPRTIGGVAAPAPDIGAALSTDAMVTDPAGFTYVLGTTGGDMGAHRGTGADDMVLTKLDSRGEIVWRSAVGSDSALTGASLALAPDGGVVIAGTVAGALDGAAGDKDMLVARYGADGQESYATVLRQIGDQSASAVAVGADGAVYVGGQTATGDAVLARLGADGALVERMTIDSGGSDAIQGLAVDAGGDVLVLGRTAAGLELSRRDGTAIGTVKGSLSLGAGDGSAMLLGPDGRIFVGGSTDGEGGRDGLVVEVDSVLTQADRRLIATSGGDRVDSLALVNGQLYAGGRTNGALDGSARGPMDGFVARFAGDGSVAQVRQFGQPGLRTDSVRIAGAPGGDTALTALGLRRGVLEDGTSRTLVAETGLRPGDSFGIRVGSRKVQTITVQAGDTLSMLADRIRKAGGGDVLVQTPTSTDGSGRTLRLNARPGIGVQLTPGPGGRDALARLGLEPQRLDSPLIDPKAPAVTPGGSFGLGLSDAMTLDTREAAAAALKRVEQAISTTQSGFRSLYWNSTKEQLVNAAAGGGGAVSAYQQSQLKSYTEALQRLTPLAQSDSGGLFGLSGGF